jgi:hypothetical protein
VVGVDERAHRHDCRHAGLILAAQSDATLRELMALGGHSTPRAAMIYQRATQEGRGRRVGAAGPARPAPPDEGARDLAGTQRARKPDDGA